MKENKENIKGLGAINLIAPRNYNELTEKQLRYIVALQQAGTPEDTIRTKCFIRFTGLKPIARVHDNYHFILPKYKGLIALNSETVATFSKKMNWITKSYIGINPVRIGNQRPCDKLLRDTLFIQYLDAENYYQAFIYTKDEKYIYKLMATIYPTGKKYDNERTEKRAKYFERKATNSDKSIVIMWMLGVKEYFARKFSFLFVAHETEGDISTQPIDMIEIINNQVRILTEGDVTKKEKVLQLQTWDALTELNEKMKPTTNY
jgi:hypothetical protein